MGIDIRKAAQQAEKRKDIYPKLKMGETGMEEGKVHVRFDQPTFGQAINPKPLPGQSGDFLTILVTVLTPSDFGHAGGEQVQVNAGPGSTLGDGLLKLWSAHKENLLGVEAIIEAYNYKNKNLQGKLTRAYRVTEHTPKQA